MALSRSQRSIAATIIGRGRRRHATRRELLAAIETGLVESNLSNPRGGSGTSVGWRQETASSYPNANRRNVAAAADRFFSEIQGKRGMRGTAGQLAQAVQRSAFPARYDQRRGEALDVLRSVDPSDGSGGDPGGQGGLSVLLRQQGGQQPLQPPDMTAVNMLAQGLQRPEPPPVGAVIPPAFSAKAPMPQNAPVLPSAGSPSPPAQSLDDQLQAVSQLVGVQPTPPPQVDVFSTPGPDGRPAPKSMHEKGVAHFDGKPVAKWIAPWLDYARKHGWKGTVNSGYRSVEEQRRIYNSGVRPAAKPGKSNHNFTAFPGGAVDVTNAAQLAHILKRAHAPLKWAGSKDPVHFSHPRGGSY